MLPDSPTYKRSKRIAKLAYDLLEATKEYTNWSEDGIETLDEIVEELYSALNKASSTSQTKKEKNKINTLLKRLDKDKEKIAEEIFFYQTRTTRQFSIYIVEDGMEWPISDSIWIDVIRSINDDYIEDEGIFPEIKVENRVYHGEILQDEEGLDPTDIEKYGSDEAPVFYLPVYIKDILGKEILELIENQDQYRTDIDDKYNVFDESKRDEWNRKYGKYLVQEDPDITGRDKIIIENLIERIKQIT